MTKITVKNEQGRPLNPYPEFISPNFALYGSKGNPEWADFERSVKTNLAPGIPGTKEGEFVEAELVWQAWEGKCALRDCEWFDCRESHKDYERNGIDTRQIYRLVPQPKGAPFDEPNCFNPEQPKEQEEKTAEGILDRIIDYDNNDKYNLSKDNISCNYYTCIEAMQAYATQQTASKDARIAELEARVKELEKKAEDLWNNLEKSDFNDPFDFKIE